MMSKTYISLAVALVCLSGCSLAPTYERPEAPVAPAWQNATTGGVIAADTGWSDFFGDEKLRKVIELALANNRDLRVTVANIEKARAQYDIERAAQLPSLAVNGAESASRTTQKLSTTGQKYVKRTYTADVGLSAYELDFFGRIQSLKEEALATYLQTEEAQLSTKISLISSVATEWLTLGADQERLRIAQATLKSRQDSLQLIRKRYDVGTASGLDLSQAQSSLDAARYDAASYTSQVALDQNALVLLMGTGLPDDLQPSGLPDRVSEHADLLAGVPSESLLQRPDVRSAEQALIATNANIGAARAAFFPTISLTASTGFASPALDGLFKGSSRTWSFAPSISMPIFDWGTTRANLDVAKAEKVAQVATYEKTVQTAFREVADALASHATLGEQLDAEKSANVATAESLRLSQARYDKGVAGYSDVLDSQRSLYAAQQSLISARLASQTNLVTLYKVLGGGVKD
jgi:outer membrane protein, multidrug efflux system